MKRLIIIVEGQTEEEFVKEVLTPYFNVMGIYSVIPIKIITNINIETSKISKGGFSNYDHLKRDALKYLREPDTIVTMFVDFFRIPVSVPGYQKCMVLPLVNQKIDSLQLAIEADINHPNFIAYIQKHEFEALLFASNRGFEELFDARVHHKTQAIIDQFPDPEEINSRPEYAPSKRLIAIMPSYEKIVDGNMLALELGIDEIMEKCGRFRNWIDAVTRAMQAP